MHAHEKAILHEEEAKDTEVIAKDASGRYSLKSNSIIKKFGRTDANEDSTFPVPPPSKKQKRKQRERRDPNAVRKKGDAWAAFHAATITPKLRKELRVLQMRDQLDPKRFFKKTGKKKKLNTNVQIGQMIDGPTDWYVDRATKKQARKSALDSALESKDVRGYIKSKFLEIQASKPVLHKRKKGKGRKRKGRK
uniref:Fcf2 pre-rRNA processing C-terminal domain-containing protein n=1 Tax=Lotharella oceanica TaxID=641309 RepID=A0A7S2TYE8_9EUKA|mmetsp:Transcript_35408/g.65588  ORF Transcript_35408/g.65588 Transcript_35408/m.65588 type:complete len:193 (+) Transcript_35408:364-942(+)